MQFCVLEEYRIVGYGLMACFLHPSFLIEVKSEGRLQLSNAWPLNIPTLSVTTLVIAA